MKCDFSHGAVHFQKPMPLLPSRVALGSQWDCRKWGSHRSGTFSQLHFHLVSLEIQFPVNEFLEFHSSPLRSSCMTQFFLMLHSLPSIATVHDVHVFFDCSHPFCWGVSFFQSSYKTVVVTAGKMVLCFKPPTVTQDYCSSQVIYRRYIMLSATYMTVSTVLTVARHNIVNIDNYPGKHLFMYIFTLTCRLCYIVYQTHVVASSRRKVDFHQFIIAGESLWWFCWMLTWAAGYIYSKACWDYVPSSAPGLWRKQQICLASSIELASGYSWHL